MHETYTSCPNGSTGRKDETVGTYSEYIEGLKKAWIGKSVLFENEEYTVVDVDYNGSLLIDKKARFTDTTAVGIEMVTAL